MTRTWMTGTVGAGVVVAVLVTAMPLRAETLDDRFRAGVAAFEAGQYEEAARVFRDLRERYQVTSPDLLANLGAAEFMAGRPGLALLRFHEAVLADPTSPAADTARVNAERVRAALNERRGDGGTGYVFGPYHDAWTALFGWVPPRGALVAFFASWALLFLSLAGWRAFGSRARRVFGGVAIAAAAGSVLTGVSAYGAARVASYEVAVVLEDGAPLYDREDSIEPRLALPEALEARVVARRGALVRIRLSSDQEGWVPERSLGFPGVTAP